MSKYGYTSVPMSAQEQNEMPPVPPGAIRMQPTYGPPPTMDQNQYNPQVGFVQQGGVMYSTQPGAVQMPMQMQMQPGMQPVGGMAAMWMPMPPPMEGVPPGLEYLTMVDTLMVHQIYEVMELLTGWECKNKYSLRNSNGEQVYYAAEESECCERQCCGNQRGFNMHIVDNFKREVIRIVRPFKCCGGGCSCCAVGCCAQECTIESPPGVVVGSVVQKPSCCSIDFIVKNEKDEEVFVITGPCCCAMMGCQDKEFPITSMSGHSIGEINKKWGGCFREAFTDADIFKVSFPNDLDVKMKAVLLGATFLIDFMAFETEQNKNN